MALPRRSAASSASSGPSAPTSGYADVVELDRYKLVCNIGKGSFGVISKVQRVEDGKEFAMKQLDYSKMTDKDRKQILAEVAILESLKHRNIVQLIQKIKDPKNERIYIVMEYCTSGDLGSLIRKAQRTGQPIHEDKIWNIFLQITLALHHCHWPAERPAQGQRAGRPSGGSDKSDVPRYQVLHRDLKPENVFLSDDFVKLGDFGLSKDMGNSAFTSTYVGTPLYMPPEILAENRYDTKSDIWSLGCLVYEMCALTSPFSTAQTQAELIQMVKSGKLPALPGHISPALTRVIKAMLTLNPVRRPSTKDLLEMDEMKLHRKLFTVQNQTSILATRKGEIKEYEERLMARSQALEEREKSLAAREANLSAREAAFALKDEEIRETQKKINQAVETLRGQWDKLREEKEKNQESIGMGLPVLIENQPPPIRRASTAPSRPLLEERATMPLPPISRLSRAPASYDDTPSKIPLASPTAIEHNFKPQSTPLRRNATKSLAHNQPAHSMNNPSWSENTPARRIFRHNVRTSIGSPHELYSEDISMAIATPLPSTISNFIPRTRKSSMVPTTSQESALSDYSEDNNKPLVERTLIPGPMFSYKDIATPIKWTLEDPDLPSPFLRRPSSAPLEEQPRQPLGAISVQTIIPLQNQNQNQSQNQTQGQGQGKGKGGLPTIRSKSGGLNLHQHVLKVNAATAEAKRMR
ncbi:hypothetical protein TREMEDRAFT_25026 [Tremella mesenterica DSM 1558]|uniref:uncharacterized protein n=1 Tax=Tremella mesenterica (strain ATCC 24925 / CBS 8224 / DSM 1558 / NBRC 9311 / NRRL Y-6157 / RJB 2259-6 / UBC 559-6) TaxID=578456 RepID=UPI0003F497D4|nr:uncharacterized protein TREMEDRAFT_25026 [Tremella mesenterica DSM 1558]EIW72063.1 hypothetical protein TREMEDRAFT_25026 [Tremella mesenterica DSM 1558]